jgi:AcrR family transcriptional regulator
MVVSDRRGPVPRRTAAPHAGAPARTRSRKGEGDKLAEEILDAAEALLIEKGGVDAVSMRAIANRVGVTPPAIYMHFDDKEALFFECCSRRFEEMAQTLAGAIGTGSATDKVTALGRAYVDFGLRRGQQYEAMFRSKVPDHLPAGVDNLPGHWALELTADLVQEGIDAGEFRADLHADTTAITLWSSVHGLVMILLRGAELPDRFVEDVDLIIDHTIEVILTGMRA